jgi:hypothetical protein
MKSLLVKDPDKGGHYRLHRQSEITCSDPPCRGQARKNLKRTPFLELPYSCITKHDLNRRTLRCAGSDTNLSLDVGALHHVSDVYMVYVQTDMIAIGYDGKAGIVPTCNIPGLVCPV